MILDMMKTAKPSNRYGSYFNYKHDNIKTEVNVASKLLSPTVAVSSEIIETKQMLTIRSCSFICLHQ